MLSPLTSSTHKKEKSSRMEDSVNQIGKLYERPWGYYKTLLIDNSFQCKIICVRPNGKLSLQKHFHRSEHWVVVKGSLLVTKGKAETLKKVNDPTCGSVAILKASDEKGSPSDAFLTAGVSSLSSNTPAIGGISTGEGIKLITESSIV